MANNWSAIAPILYGAGRIVPRELTGLIAAVDVDFSDKNVAKGDTVTVPISPVATVGAFTAAQTFTAGTDRTATSKILTLGQENVSSWNMTSEQERSLGNGGTGDDVLAQTTKQHIRAHVNAIETYLWGVARKAASRATGTAATSPFATDQKPLADALKIMLDNGAGNMDMSAVIDTVAGADLRKVANLFKVNEGGNDSLLRYGVLGSLYNFDIRESAAVTTATKGTGTLYTSSAAGFAIGATSIPIITGSGTVLAGDVVTFAGDTNKYVVTTGLAAPGTLVIAEPGLRIALAASAVAMTVGNTATQNLCLRRDAVKLVARPGLQPETPAIQQWTIADEQSKLSFLVYRAVGDGMASWYMRTVFDAVAINPYAVVQLLG